MGFTFAGVGGVVAASFWGEGSGASYGIPDRVLDALPIITLAAVGGGIAGAILAPGK